jgi:glycosyltransferase involved in cell wall biosynthesis
MPLLLRGDSLKAAIVKPDYGIKGGFEIVVEMLANHLPANLGMDVEVVKVDMSEAKNITFPFSNEELRTLERWPALMNYFRKLLLFRSKGLEENLSRYDVIFSTQPPSHVISHRNHFSLFFHHERVFYDLLDYSIRSGVISDELRELATYVRSVDTYFMQDVRFIAASENVADRLNKYNRLSPIGIFYAGIDADFLRYDGNIEYTSPICVGRHEFPKRPDLFLKAMKELDGLKGIVVGSGGRTQDLVMADRFYTYMSHNEFSFGKLSENEIQDMIYLGKKTNNINSFIRKLENSDLSSNVSFTGSIDHQDLLNQYSKALCVVCPAYDEDYGLTAIEAMAMRKPVIACEDGGGYTELIENGITGLIVPPEPTAIADAIRKLQLDLDYAKQLGMNGYEKSKSFTWNNAVTSITKLVRDHM